ncbi:MAG: ABC transporter substrate-binding protein [Chloroflexi bacterium]|nr:ABC transporter substrate-binding protein [Chloroflexota bacterium]
MRYMKLWPKLTLLMLAIAAMAVVACSDGEAVEPEIVIQTVIVTEKGDTVVETVVVTEKGDTVTVKGDTVVVTATPVLPATATPVPADKPAPPSKSASGQLVWSTIADSGIGSGFNAGNLCCGAKMMSVVETLFKPTHAGGPATPLLAKTWELDSTNSPPKYVDVTIESGIMFHGGYGELTADDLVWNINDTNPNLSETLGTGNISITDGSGTWAGFLGANATEKTGDYSVRINWESFDPRWDTWFFGQDGLGAGIVSKNAYDTEGEEWNQDQLIGTGPFEMTSWQRGDRAVFTAVDNHWRQTPEVTSITRIAVPDETVRLAQLATGDADIADVSISNVSEAQRIGMTAKGSGAARMVTMMFAGNLWETNHPTTGEELDIVTYTHDLPWLGNPHKPADSNNPAGMDDMEQARLVRQALAMSIDRDLINEAALSGLGWPVYIPYFDINNPNWDDKWKIEYDPDGAEALLDQAGFPRDSSGKRFSMPMFAWPIGHFYGEIGDNVSIFWEEIGVSTDVLHYEYAVFRPTLVGRSATQAWTDTGPLENYASTPWDWPRGIQMSALARGGKSHGLENPESTANYQAVSGEATLEGRIDLNNGYADWMSEWLPGFGIVASPSLLVFNPNSISSWDMELGLRQTSNSPELIKLK